MQSRSEVIASSKSVRFPHAVQSLPSSCEYPCQCCSSTGASEEQLYTEKLYLTPGWKLAGGKVRDHYVSYSVTSHLLIQSIGRNGRGRTDNTDAYHFHRFKGMLTWLNSEISVSSSQLDPLHRTALLAQGIIPFQHITTGGVGIALPEQRETSVHIIHLGHSQRFHIWEEEIMDMESRSCKFLCFPLRATS